MLFDTIDRILFTLYQASGYGIFSYCQPSAVSSKGYITMDNGSFMSILEIHGVYQYQTLAGETDMLNGLSAGIRGALAKPGRAMQIVFAYDPFAGRELARTFFDDMKRSARARNLDMDFLLMDTAEAVGKHIADERVLVCLWSKPTVLTPHQIKMFQKEVKQYKIPPTSSESQNMKLYNRDLEISHEEFVKSIIASFSNDKVDINIEELSKEEIVKTMRTLVDPEMTTRFWKPTFHSLLKNGSIFEEDDYLSSGFFQMPLPGEKNQYVYFPSLKKLIFPRDAVIIDSRIIRIGSHYHMPLYLSLAPQQVQRFNRLLAELRGKGCAFRLLWTLDSDGPRAANVSIKRFVSAVLGVASSTNKRINAAYKALDAQRNAGESIVGFTGVFDVWRARKTMTEAQVIDQLRSDVSIFMGAMNMWGTQEIRDAVGDPWQAFCAGVPGLTLQGPMDSCLGGIRDLVDMFPFFRAYSPWKSGGLRRTVDGKPFPYLQNSSSQNSWLTLGVAGMGGGKSVTLNMENLEFILSAGKIELPYLSIIDFGVSSQGVINLIKYSLPEKDQNLVIYTRLRNVVEDAINPFDIPLCCRKPSSQHKTFLIDFITLLTTPLGSEKPLDGVEGFLSVVIDEAYKEMESPRAQNYVKNYIIEVDNALDKISNFKTDKHTKWFQVAEVLFRNGFEKEAYLAHREAMPVIRNIVTLCSKPELVQGFARDIGEGETLPQYVQRKLRDTINLYPVLSSHTRFSLGEARIISLDLEEVARGGAAMQARQAGIFYLLAYHLLSTRFTETPEEVNKMPEFVREYHRKRIERMRELPKKLCIDEAHRLKTAGKDLAEVFGKLLETVIRESRKHRILVTLMSQKIDDFSENIRGLASAFYVLGRGNMEEIEKINTIFGLGSAGKDMQQSIARPGPAGSTSMSYFVANDKVICHNLMLTIGPAMLWAFTTTKQDMTLRDRLYNEVGVMKTLRFLGQQYPGGVQKIIEARTRELMRTNKQIDVEDELYQLCRKKMKVTLEKDF